MTIEGDRFAWPDYLTLVITLMMSCAVGMYYWFVSKKNQSTEEFLMAGRNMHPVPVALSMFVSQISAISFIADPVEVHSIVFIIEHM